MKKYNVAIAGATGAVGQVIREILEERNFPVNKLKLLASERSVGRKLLFHGHEVEVEQLSDNSFNKIDFALFSAGASRSLSFAPIAVESGAIVIDNSSAYREDPEIPLVVPEVNKKDLSWHNGIIANPNCSTIQMVVVLKPIHDIYRIKRIVVSTYQAVSGTGRQAQEELLIQAENYLNHEQVNPKVYPHQIAFNLLPHIDVFMDNLYTKEEVKMVNETKKIMGDNEINVTATAVRVPVFIGHSEAVNLELEKSYSLDDMEKILAAAPGVVVLDDPSKNIYPMPIDSAGQDGCFVGRIRRDDTIPSGLNLWIVSDNLRKGAALNAVQIAEELIKSN